MLACLSYAAFARPIRHVESTAVSLVGGRFGDSIGRVVPSLDGVVVNSPDERFIVLITSGCSAMTVVATVWFIGLAFFRTNIWRRVFALFASAPLLLLVNVLRLLMVVSVGAKWGVGPLTVVHDWFGTMISLASGSMVLWLVVRICARKSPHPRGRP